MATTSFHLHSFPPTHTHLQLPILWMLSQVPSFLLRTPFFLSHYTGVQTITQDLAEMIVYLVNKYLSTATVLGNPARFWEHGMDEIHFPPARTFQFFWSLPGLVRKVISVLPWHTKHVFSTAKEGALALVFLSLAQRLALEVNECREVSTQW